MKEKGFTLIELLAVIVILAIIAIIVTPMIADVISNSKKAANKQSAVNYADSIQNAIATCMVKGSTIADGTYDINDLQNACLEQNIEINGTKPASGSFTVTNGELVDYSFVIGDLTYKKDGTVTEGGTTTTYTDAILNGADPVLVDGMIPVVIADNGTVTKADTKEPWYDYTYKKWANMVLIKDSTKRATYVSASAGTTITQSDIAAYYVWIPRYRYAITEDTTGTNPARLINVIFETSTTAKSSGNAVGTNYLTHPAFTFGTEETNGFWFAKFETTGDATTPTILPSVTSLRSQNVSTQFTTAQKFANYLVTPASADSHMSKNSEWGAVAYLVNSVYGRYNSTSTCITSGCEVWINNVEGFITGCAGASVSASGVSGTACPSGYDWKTSGVNASTTGNISGIYDMSGGAWEYVMGNYSSTLGYSGFSTLPNAKYYQTYTGSALNTACNGSICYGDALSETANWNGDYANMVYTPYPWFRRGGIFNDGSGAGVFYVFYYSGGASGSGSFRAVLVP